MTFSAVLHNRAIDPKNRAEEPGIADCFFGERLEQVSITTTLGGFGALQARLLCEPAEATDWQHRLFWHLVATSYGERVYEGRLEQVSRAENGVQLAFIGYYNHLDDLPYNSKAHTGDIEASALAIDIVHHYAPMLVDDTQFIKIPGLKLKGSDFDGGDTPKRLLESVLEGSDNPDPVPFYPMVRTNRRLWLVPQERALISWTIPSRSLSSPPAYTRDSQELYSAVKTLFERKVKSSSGTTTVRDDATTPDNATVLAELGGNRRVLTVSSNKSVNAADKALAWGTATLGDHLTGVTRFSLTVRGMVENHIGGLLEPWFMQAGALARLDGDPNDERVLDDAYRLFVIAETSWNVTSGEVTLQCEPIHGTQLDTAKNILASSGLVKVA